MIRSPAGAPALPFSPWPESRSFEPVSTPDGTFSRICRFSLTCPLPAQTAHGFVGTEPRPRHTGHGRVTAKPPWPNEMVPDPLHSGQVFGLLPGALPEPPHVAHESVTGTLMLTLPPRAAVSNGISTTYSTSCPRCGALVRPRVRCCCCCCRRRSKNELNRSPSPPRSPRSSNVKRSSCTPPGDGRVPAAPCPKPKPPSGPILRIWSYCLRLVS